MHRGPAARVPFCAMSASQIHRDAALFEAVHAIVSNRRGTWQEATAPQAGPRNAVDMRASHAAQRNGRPDGGRSYFTRIVQPSGAGAQTEFRHADREVEPDRTVDRDRLQRHGAIGAADENVRAEAGGNGHLAARAEIVAGEKARTRGRVGGEYAPDHHAARGGADIEPEFADRPAIGLLRTGRLRRETRTIRSAASR